MKGMVSREKMSRKNRRILDLERRSAWERNPVTRIRESGRLYNRRKAKVIYDED